MEVLEIKDFKELAFGENLYQKASIAPVENGIEYEVINEGNSLEYVDYVNLSRVVEILAEFFDVNAVAIAKEGLLCSTALGSSSQNALEKILDCDPISVCNGTVGFTKEITLDIAKQLKAMKIRNLIATKFEKSAIEDLTNNSEINIIQIKSPLQEVLGFNAKDIKVTPFGYLVQEQNQSKLTKSSFKVSGKTKPTQQQAEDAIFAWKVAKYIKSKAVVIAKDLTTKAIVQGKTNEVEAIEQAMDIACENSKDAVLTTDSSIENVEAINVAIQGRIGLIIDAGDNNNSNKIIKLADKYNISIITTGIRNNRY